ncbi:MAG: FAD-dependent oxidoreductase [Deltaproteobacteria bacterium]|nr:FAD-dependent oxidoreductase [Deltaproteobacteria bacterium]
MVGKLIVAVDEAQRPDLQRLAEQAVANGSPPLQEWSRARLREFAPGVRGVAALWSPGTGIVDPHSLVHWYRRQAQAAEAVILVRHTLLAAERCGPTWQLQVQQADGAVTTVECDAVVNAAGLQADRVARLACDAPDLPEHRFVKGSYFDLSGPAPAPCLVYPLPMPHLLGLGTHLTLDLAGQARLGPDTQLVASDDDYAVDPQRGEQFLQAARPFLADLGPERLRPGFAGIRPKLAIDRAADFYIAEESARGAPGWVNLLGIESPGLTASWAIGAEVTKLLTLA